MKNAYTINLFDLDGFEELTEDLNKLEAALGNGTFMKFLAKKCIEEVNRITNERLRTENYTTEYRSNHEYSIDKYALTISNNTMVDLSEVSEETLENYPNGLSLAKIVEFGVGILGTDNSDFDWETQMNPNRDYNKGWFYVRDGQIHFTKGHEGKFIYYELSQSVQKNFSKWFNEFLEEI